MFHLSTSAGFLSCQLFCFARLFTHLFSMVTFDKNITIPNLKRKGKENSMRNILQSMYVWDSFLFDWKKIKSLSAAIARYKEDRMFLSRTVEWGVRVWRVQ